MVDKSYNRFEIQDEQYRFPYHHLVDFSKFNNYVVMSWGFEYYAYIKKVLDIILVSKPKSILDIGCGEGKMILELSKSLKGVHMKGVDLSPRAIFFAKAFNYGNGSVFECADVSKVDGLFDVITLIETMEHIPDSGIDHIVDNVSRLVNSDGKVIITVPTTNFPLQDKHYRHYDIELIKKQFKSFEVEDVYYMVSNSWIHKILIRLSRKFCSFSILRILFFRMAEFFVFKSDKDHGRHLVCVLKKSS